MRKEREREKKTEGKRRLEEKDQKEKEVVSRMRPEGKRSREE